MPKKRRVQELVSNIQTVPIDSLRPDPDNARVHGDKSIDALMGSFRQFGQVEPLVVQEGTNRIIGGHGRLEALKRLGYTQVKIITAGFDDLHSDALALAMNHIPNVGTAWDNQRVTAKLKELHDDGFAIEGIGFETADIEGFGFAEPFHEPQESRSSEGAPSALSSASESSNDSDGRNILDTESLEDPDIPDVPDEAITQRGDVWVLGKHRLMCGDSTSQDDVPYLMNGQLADIVFTSPPYDQQRDYTQKITDWQALMRGVFGTHLPVKNTAQLLVNLGLIYIDGQWHSYWDPWIAWMQDQGWRKFGWYVWDKLSGMPGNIGGRPASCHEWLFHINRETRSPNKIAACKFAGKSSYRETPRALASSGGAGKSSHYANPDAVTQAAKIPDSVFRTHAARTIHKPEAKHPAVFPVELAAQVIAAYSDLGEIAYEPFSGSGTTLLAAEQLGRLCCAMEIAPAYCDIAVQRWENLTGQKAERIPAQNA